MSNQIQDIVLKCMEADANATNEAIALKVREVIPGAKTTPASVSSIKSRLKSQIAMGGSLPSGNNEALAALTFDNMPTYNPEEDPETEEEALQRISVRYSAMERMGKRLIDGGMPSLIISGPPGLGKSYGIEQGIAEREDLKDFMSMEPLEDGEEIEQEAEEEGLRIYDNISGSITAVGLYQALWHTRKGGVLVLDDIDEVFRDEVCLNLLKAALDSGKKRVISWRKEAAWLENYGIDKSFDFQGHVVFLTNIDFEAEIAKDGKMAEHFKALIDRSYYLCLTLRTKRDFMLRIKQVAEGEEGMLCKIHGLSVEASEEVLDFIEDNSDRFYNLSLRLADQVARMRALDPEGWREDVEATKMRSY